MTGPRKASAVREPVQVYLAAPERKLLREAAAVAGVSGAEILRRGLRRMAGELLADRSPAMRLLEEMNAATWAPDTPSDVSVHHDEYLAGKPSAAAKRRKSTKRR